MKYCGQERNCSRCHKTSVPLETTATTPSHLCAGGTLTFHTAKLRRSFPFSSHRIGLCCLRCVVTGCFVLFVFVLMCMLSFSFLWGVDGPRRTQTLFVFCYCYHLNCSPCPHLPVLPRGQASTVFCTKNAALQEPLYVQRQRAPGV